MWEEKECESAEFANTLNSKSSCVTVRCDSVIASQNIYNPLSIPNIIGAREGMCTFRADVRKIIFFHPILIPFRILSLVKDSFFSCLSISLGTVSRHKFWEAIIKLSPTDLTKRASRINIHCSQALPVCVGERATASFRELVECVFVQAEESALNFEGFIGIFIYL